MLKFSSRVDIHLLKSCRVDSGLFQARNRVSELFLNLQTWAPFMTIQYFPCCFWIFLYVFALPTLTELYPKVNLFLDVARGMARRHEWGSEAEQPGGAPSWEMPLLAWPSLSRPSSFLLPQVGPTTRTQSPLQWYSLPAPVSWWKAEISFYSMCWAGLSAPYSST